MQNNTTKFTVAISYGLKKWRDAEGIIAAEKPTRHGSQNISNLKIIKLHEMYCVLQ
jgi:hypothetical protein